MDRTPQASTPAASSLLWRWFIVFFVGILGYGMALYYSVPLKYFDLKMPQYFPSEISGAYEEAFTEGLSTQKNPALMGLARSKWTYLNTPFIHKVEKGRDNWIFLNEEFTDRNSIYQSLGVQRYSTEELKLWKLVFKQRYEWTKDNGMDYAVVVAPNKETIYPEFLPGRYHKGADRTVVDQIMDALPEIRWIDLREPLQAAKNRGRLLYYPDDTHWNDFGGMVGYRYIMSQLPPPFQVSEIDSSDFVVRPARITSGDLARFMLLDKPEGQIVDRIHLRDTQTQTLDRLPLVPGNGPRRFECPQAPELRVFFQHDSFLRELFHHFSRHYRHTAFWWKWRGFEVDFIKKWKPQLVVNELVERSLIGYKARNHPELIQHYWQKHYAELPLAAKVGYIPVKKAVAEVERRYLPEEHIHILRLEIATPIADTIQLVYGDETVNYPVHSPATTLYIEYEPQKLKYIRPLGNAALTSNLEIRAY